MLYIVATPIGNLEDITIRALKILRQVEYIFAEDTRRINILLKKFKIKNRKVQSFHKFNELKREGFIFKILSQNSDVAIVSDAGTPLISDPGENLIKSCFEKDIKFSPIPGVSALTTLLSVTPFENKEFIFIGFPERTDKRKKTQFENLLNTGKNIFFFEAPNRIISTLKIIRDISSSLKILVGRELTKIYEEFLFDNVSNLIKHFEKNSPVGEFTVGIYNDFKLSDDYKKDIEIMRNLNFSNREIISFISAKYNLKKNKVYEYLKENA